MGLRAAQLEILKYDGGRLAVSAVPGSGKTFTLSLLASRLIADQKINVTADQQILVVTYLNASVDSFRARIRQELDSQGLPLAGYDVRTLHSVALEIVQNVRSGGQDDETPIVADEIQAGRTLTRAVDAWIDANPELWRLFLVDDSPQKRVQWRDAAERSARTFIKTAKNWRIRAPRILDRISEYYERGTDQELWNRSQPSLQSVGPEEADFSLLLMLSGIYQRYQAGLTRQGVLDFDDLVWLATDYLEDRKDLRRQVRQRWPYILEDEAQDSVPLQELLLRLATGETGNWVRVGDPNQAITSTFTAAHPRYFNAFLDEDAVKTLPLPNSGRCAPLIFGAANSLVHWVTDKHPVAEVRRHAFRRQDMLPTPPGDAQPNPPDDEADIRIRVFEHREDEELPGVAVLAVDYAKDLPEHTLAILVPTNHVGHMVAEHLDGLDAKYDNLLRGNSRERETAAALQAILGLMADPLGSRVLAEAFAALGDLNHPSATAKDIDIARVQAILRSVHRPETFLFPSDNESYVDALPAGIATPRELEAIESFSSFLRQLYPLRELAIDEAIMAISDEVFGASEREAGDVGEADLATAYQIASFMRGWLDLQPEWRLPELAAQLAEVASGRQPLPQAGAVDSGYEPAPGRITLATQHGAKGMEWDAVFLVGIDGFWIPTDLEATFMGVYDSLGGDPTAEAIAQLRYLIEGDAGLFPQRTATESAHIEIICERLRLLYVGITRARRFLHLSRSTRTRRKLKDYEREPASALGELHRYVRSRRKPA